MGVLAWLAGTVLVLAILNELVHIWYGAKLIEHKRKQTGYYDEH